MGRSLRQIPEACLGAVTDTLAAETAATDGDDGLVYVPGRAESLGVDHLRGDEGHNALELVILEQRITDLLGVLFTISDKRILRGGVGLRVLVNLGRVIMQIHRHYPHHQKGGGTGH